MISVTGHNPGTNHRKGKCKTLSLKDMRWLNFRDAATSGTNHRNVPAREFSDFLKLSVTALFWWAKGRRPLGPPKIYFLVQFILVEIRGRHGGVEKEGGWKTSRMTPLPKRAFGPPLVRYVFHPPRVSVLCFSCTKIHDRWDQKLFWRGCSIFGRARSLVRFPPPIRFAPPHITAQWNIYHSFLLTGCCHELDLGPTYEAQWGWVPKRV